MTIDLEELAELELTGPLEDTTRPRPPSSPAPPSLTQRVTVHMDDGTDYTATLDARDRRAYALNADRYGLPPFTMDGAGGGPVDVLALELLTVFGVWHATRHRLHLHRMDWPAFSARALEVDVSAASPDPVAYPPGRGVG